MSADEEAALLAAIHEFCELARQTALMLNEAMKLLEDLRRKIG